MKKLLLDENLPRQLKNYFGQEFQVTSVPDLGWQSKTNGELLASLESEGISHLLTAGKNLPFQQNLSRYRVTVVLILSHDVRLKNLARWVPEIEHLLSTADPSETFLELDLRSK